MEEIIKYRIRFTGVFFKNGMLYFNLEKSTDNWKTIEVLIRGESASYCKQVLDGILAGEKEVIVVKKEVSTRTYI